jgi:hypothetical protein
MHGKFKLAVIVLLVAPMNISLAQGEPDSLTELPDWQIGVFRVDPYIRTASKLQALGKDRAINYLVQFAKTRACENQVIVLSRMLFMPKGQEEFRSAGIGAADFFGGTNNKDWPLAPITLIDDIPFLITFGYSLRGKRESAESYVKYCTEKCAWSKVEYKLKTEKEKQAALGKLLASPKWKIKLDDTEKQFLSLQIKQPIR